MGSKSERRKEILEWGYTRNRETHIERVKWGTLEKWETERDGGVG